MTGFDFLHDTLPEGVEWLRNARLPRSLRAVATAAVALLGTALLGSWLESSRLSEAVAVDARAQARFEASSAAVAALKVQARDLDKLLKQDRRLRAIRLSGPLLAERLATLGNLAPRHVWLTSMEAGESGYRIAGGAADLGALTRLLANLSADRRTDAQRIVRITRAGTQDRALSFDVETLPAR